MPAIGIALRFSPAPDRSSAGDRRLILILGVLFAANVYTFYKAIELLRVPLATGAAPEALDPLGLLLAIALSTLGLLPLSTLVLQQGLSGLQYAGGALVIAGVMGAQLALRPA